MHEITVPAEITPSDTLLRAAVLTLGTGFISLFISKVSAGQAVFDLVPISIFTFVFVFLFLRRMLSKETWYTGTTSPLQILNRQEEVTQTDSLMEHLPVAILRLNNSGNVVFANKEARQILGRNDIKNMEFASLVEGLGRSMRERLRDALSGNGSRSTEMGRCLRDGQEVFLQVSLMQMSYIEFDCCIAILSDKTELKMLEAQFVQSQKMEAVGQLAGGVAHDFNNLLTAINGHSDLLLLRHKSGDEDYGDLVQIRQNSVRAAALVRQLLAFSRKQTLRPKIVNLVVVLRELTQLLNRLLGEKVTLEIEENPDLHPVRIDVQQFEQVIMNLVVNARDAMRDGGNVTITADNITLTSSLQRERATVPVGDYVVLRIKDRGCGIEPDILPKIFEPFFTTKRIGEGTGLGLSTVYGIIKQTGGFVFVSSKKDVGSQFEIYLPVHAKNQTDTHFIESKPEPAAETSAIGHILLVEDEVAVRSFAARALKLKGYTVDEAGTGEDALDMLESGDTPYDLFISDVIMPGMDGPSWVLKAIERGYLSKVIFVSGYPENAFSESKKEVVGAGFLAKPFSLNDLVQKVDEVLKS